MERRWRRGLPVHLSIYAFLPEENQAILQCFFCEVADGDRVVTRLFVFPVNIPAEGELRTYLLANYTSAIVSSSLDTIPDSTTAANGSGVGGEVGGGGGSGDECADRVARRSRALAQILMHVGPDFEPLTRFFTPVEIFSDGVEILGSRRWENVRGIYNSILQTLAALTVGRIRAIGSYHQMADAVSIETSTAIQSIIAEGATTEDAEDECRYRNTHAYRKLRRGFVSRDITFSIRIGNKKFMLSEPSAVGAKFSVSDVFVIQDVKWRGKKLRLCFPREFLAFVFSDDQCLVLLRDAMQRLFKEVYGGFSGLYPVFDFFGPNMLRSGGPRSVFFPGFPAVAVYSVPWRYDMNTENGADAINEIRSLVGLPDIVGVAGKVPLVPEPGNAVDTLDAVRMYDIDLHYADMRHFRINARLCVTHDMGDAALDDESSVAHIYVGVGGVCRISIVDLRFAVLRMCLPGPEFPFVLSDVARRVDRMMIDAFLQRLAHSSPRIFRRVRSLENYICKRVMDACEDEGYPWILVRDDCEIFVRRPVDCDQVNFDTIVRANLARVWAELFGLQYLCPVCRITVAMSGVLFATGKYLLSGFPDEQKYFPTPGWVGATGRLLSEAVFCAFQSPDWGAKDKIIRFMATHMLRLSARRHETRFWAQRFAPGRNRVQQHDGVMDANEFCGIHVCGRMVAVQPLDGALHDNICYNDYVKKTFEVLRVTLEKVIIVLSQDQTNTAVVNNSTGEIDCVAIKQEVTDDAIVSDTTGSDELDAALRALRETTANTVGMVVERTDTHNLIEEFNDVFQQTMDFVVERYSAFFSMN
ncbi:helicase-primase component [Murid betaherpesvirus 1]|uniref:Helicase-primase component n=5 Tax=Muromegalovirus muridbeta1 TaxID=3050323 RepID=D3XDS6_MUHVS